ncbi:MAG TPA: hypothetical protein VMC84_06690 [Methanocella sp.]|uniref:hypothetical protein n=1 Tax=Methanocella sp. TaxID=2052833 RepID=UPI002CA8B3AD|nr:hypothetical protein [Methanocella sp.]HTY90848.1 hypothetical protein [Methanocella sp.]
MKGMKSVILLMILMAFIAVSADGASAAVNVFVNATMPYDVLYQGQIVSANVTVKNNENFPVRVYSVGVHYDWMPEGVFTSVDFGGGYVQVESNSVTSPGQLLIQCDSSVPTGYHSFYYKVALDWYNSYTGIWINESVVQPGTIYIESPLKPQALQELQFANQSLSDFRNSGYSSSRATADVNNATGLLNDGWSAYNTNDYSRALNDSYAAINLTTDAKIAEKNYRDNVTGVEKVVASVNDKLKTIRGTTDPDTKSAIARADGYLNMTRQSIDAEDFMTAMTNANLANGAADDAIQKQFYASLKANQTEASKATAREALDNAQAALDNASNMTSTASMKILDDARTKLGNATIMFTSEDYDNATITANVVSSLAQQAESDEASYRMLLARNRISSAGQLQNPDAKAMLDNATRMYNQSESDFIASHFKDCIRHADSAAALADNATATEKSWRAANPLSAATPGFGIWASLLAIGLIFILRERKL